MIVYHRTRADIASAIMCNGFRDATGPYMTIYEHTGVWVSDRPLDINEGADGDTLLRIELRCRESELADYEWIEDEKPYREWLVPAALLNSLMMCALVEKEDE
jgi:hypothetical protein